MNMSGKRRKGTTLAELCVVLAVIAIVSALVVSFSVLMGQRVALSTTRLNAMNDMESVDAFVEGWLGRMKLLDAELSLEVNEITDDITGETTKSTKLKAVKDGREYRLFFAENAFMLIGDLPGGTTMTYTPTVVTGVKFKQVEKVFDETDKLFFCSLTYNLPGVGGGAGEQHTDTFCVNPRVGDAYGSVSDPEDAQGGAAE